MAGVELYQPTDDVQATLDWLLANGFDVMSSNGGTGESFGNQAVVLDDGGSVVRLSRDRSEWAIHIQPAEWDRPYGLELLIGVLKGAQAPISPIWVDSLADILSDMAGDLSRVGEVEAVSRRLAARSTHQQLLRPKRLKRGDGVRVVAPSCSLAMIGQEIREAAANRFSELGLALSFGQHVESNDDFESSSIEERVEDLHEAFADPEVHAILSVIGGYNSNQLLPYLDWGLIRNNPKIFCGYSDITALSCAMLAKAGLVTFSGPHFSSFGMIEQFDQTLAWFEATLMAEARVDITSSPTWCDDEWWDNQNSRQVQQSDGPWILAPGRAEGRLVGGNLCTLNLLHGTDYMPDLSGAVVFVEDDFESLPHTFDRDLASLTQQRGFSGVQALLIGRFQSASGMTGSLLEQIVASNRALADIPVVANMDFGHTFPIATFPVGGRAWLDTDDAAIALRMSW